MKNIESAQYRLSAARERAIQENKITRQRVAEAWEQLQASNTMVQAWDTAEKQEAEGIALTEKQLVSGGATQIVLLKLRQSLLETQIQGVQYRAQKQLAWITLLNEAGVLTLKNINSIQQD